MKTSCNAARLNVRYAVGVDIGGTFTDFAAFDFKRARMFVEKILTTPDTPADGVMHGLSQLETNCGVQLDEVGKVLHATTLATNAVIERKGAQTGLLTTAGFEDVLDIRKGLRYNQYDLKIQMPKPYVPRFLRRGISERTLATGQVHRALESSEILEKVHELVREGITSLAISFLHSYRNPSHERTAMELIQAKFPQLAVSVSHEVTAQFREYERTSTVVVDAYIKPLIRQYIEDLSRRLKERDFAGTLLIMTCTGGVVEPAVAQRIPVLLLESGPVAGVSISALIARTLNLKGVFSFDMGGTTAKGCVVRNRRIEKAYEFEAARFDKYRRGSGVPISIPVVSLLELGSGGGSIAKIDQLGIVRVGPESAGAKPGPACYGLGGKNATVTDADLVLGYLDEYFFLGGKMKLHVELARSAVQDSICAQSELDLERAAWAIHERANEDVAAALRLYASEIGVDYRDYALVAFGGAGPVHAARIAKKLGCSKVIIPLRAGVLSAEGLLVTPLSIDLSQTKRHELSDLDYASYSSSFEDLIEAGLSLLSSAGVERNDISVSRTLDMCYLGQGYEIPVELAGRPAREEFLNLRRIFERAYKAKYPIVGPSRAIEITAFKASLTAPPLKVSIHEMNGLSEKFKSNRNRTRSAFDPNSERFRKFSVVSRYSLEKNDVVRGPVLIQEIESTAVLPSGHTAKMDAYNNLVMTVA